MVSTDSLIVPGKVELNGNHGFTQIDPLLRPNVASTQMKEVF